MKGKKLTKKQRRLVLARMAELLGHSRGFTRGTLYTARRRSKVGFDNAARYLRRGGEIEPGDYGFCLLGAAEVAVREVVPGFLEDAEDGYSLANPYRLDNGRPAPAVVDQLSILTLAKAKGHASVPNFNDDPAIKKKDVLAVVNERLQANS